MTGQITPAMLEAFLVDAVPSFREDCLASRAINGEADTYYLLLFDFEKHLRSLYGEGPASHRFLVALRALDSLLKYGNKSVRDAIGLQIIDLLIRDPGLLEAALGSGCEELRTQVSDHIRAWDQWRSNQRRLL